MLIRQAVPGDAAAVETVRIEGWRSAYAGLLDARFLAALRLDPERVAARAEMIASPGTVCLLAESGGEAVGIAALRPAEPDSAELASLYVAAPQWGTGLGSALLVEGFARLPRPRQVLWVLRDNARARRFYERHGFAPDGASQEIEIGGPLVEVRYARGP